MIGIERAILVLDTIHPPARKPLKLVCPDGVVGKVVG